MNIWTLDKLWNEFSYQKSEEGLKSLRDDICRYNKYLAQLFGKKEPKDIAVTEIDALRFRLLKHLKPATVKQVLVLLKRIISFGVKKQLILPVSINIQLPKVSNEVTENLSNEQIKTLLQVLNEEPNTNVASLMKTALFTGMRRGELFELQWQDIDFEHGFIDIRNPKSGISQKIPLNENTREIFQRQTRTDSPYVFPGRLGGKLNDIKFTANRIKARAQLPKDFRPLHGLRHVYASMLASSGQVDLYTLQKLLTHKSPQMTQRYAHLRDETLKKASNLVGDIINETINADSNKKIA